MSTENGRVPTAENKQANKIAKKKQREEEEMKQKIYRVAFNRPNEPESESGCSFGQHSTARRSQPKSIECFAMFFTPSPCRVQSRLSVSSIFCIMLHFFRINREQIDFHREQHPTMPDDWRVGNSRVEK